MTSLKTHLTRMLDEGLKHEAASAKQVPTNSPEYKARLTRAALLLKARDRIAKQTLATE